ncbi:MAG: YciI family protein [Albidovulum sp.]|nr:YciI family protein [Albidovulum sp.]
MYFAAFCTHNPGIIRADSEVLAAFADYLRNHPEQPGVVVHNAGPTLADDSESIVGSLLIIEANSLDAARRFLAESPYGNAGVFAETQVRPFDWRLGRPE